MAIAAPPATDARRGGAIWARRAVLLLIAILAVIVAVRNAVLPALIRTQPQAAMGLWPRSGAAEAAAAMDRVQDAGGAVDATSMKLARDALSREPLLATPLVVAGLGASERNDDRLARRLFEEARRRDPRDPISRYWLFDDYLRHGDYRAGIAEATPLIRIRPIAADAVVAVLTALLDVPAARPALREALAKGQPWRRAFFAQAAANPRLQSAAASLLDREYGGSDAVVLAQMVDAGNVAGAYDLWRSRLPAAYRNRAAGIYDGDFLGWPGAAPFNWRLRAGSGLNLSRIGDGDPGLLVSGVAAAVPFADQLVPLAAGRYRFAFTVKDAGSASSDTGVTGTVRCGGRSLARAVATPQTGATAVAQADVTLAKPCAGALVRLAVAPGVDPAPFDLVVSGVGLTPVR